MTRSRQHLMVCYLGWMALLTLVYYLNPDDRIIWWTAMGLSGVGAIVVGTRLNRPAHPTYWYVLAAANLSFTIGEVMQVIYTEYLHVLSYPTFADAFYLAEYVLYAIGVAGFIRWRTAHQDRGSMLDALTLTVGLALLVWLYLIVPYERNPDLTWFQRAVSIAYPLGDVLLLLMLMRLLVPRGGKSRALLLLTIGSIGMLVADVLYGLIQLHGVWHIGSPVDLGWALFYTLWGAAALHPSMVELTRPIPTQPTDITKGRLALLTAASLIAPGMLLLDVLNGDTSHAGVIGTFSAVLFLLVLARLAGIVVIHRHQLERERALRVAGASLAAAVTFTEVAETVQTAAVSLMRSGDPGAALLAVSDDGVLRAGQGANEAVLRIPPMHEVYKTRLLPVEDLGGGLEEHFGDLPSALVCPLALEKRALGEPLIGVLIVGGTEHQLTALWGTLDILAAQSALAVERVMLSREVNQRNSELYFRTLVQSGSDVILILDEDDGIRYASSSAERVLGYPNLVGTRLADLAPPEASRAVNEALARMRTREQAEQREHWRLLREDRSVIEVEVRWNDLRSDSTVGGLVLTLRDVTDQRQMERELTHRAFHDSLTGLANRVLFQDRVGHALTRSERRGTVTGVLFIDLDDFKVVNDTQGHAVGDELLVAVSLRVSTALRTSDTAARLGGDEFAVLVEDALSPADVGRTADAVLGVFEEPFRLSSGAVRVAASVGLATTEDSIDSAELLTHADLALYSAKAAGKRQWCGYQPQLQAGLVERHELNESLDTAIAESAFALYYQPIVDLLTGDLVAFEALVRWPHERRGMVLPEEFISLAEESGQIVPLGAWVLERAATEATAWQRMSGELREAAGRRPLRVSVNVSARQFRDAGFVDTVRKTVETSGIAPESLILELTESVLMRRDERVRTDMQTLGDLGVRIAIDDFGTGYSSLSYLREFPISVLKIDKSFIDGLGLSQQQYALVEGITRIADTLGVQVIAEGIENVDQRHLLAAMGCPLGQGYLFARPLTADQAGALVQQDAERAGLQNGRR
ncbi:putative bifunctional diguanylate cyclase/phosphodiesterase [Kitasatospora paracochleata]|uniref:Diguanylate cyclase (GGDEF)-like protein/PAS domain S-box-containing protein n=1 Tax=Kitasatospora paracochleata TaxID=58354 RepID=A0ABT1IVD2_9ACTN|nr:EAL domain-containing protein [Kitasatospora paracochleata]MCP2309096.1 diguanylate cyclase (GGDEF)-like protein/PAS domain S-box-containing protein [Kitasatospora paracochleata]